MKQLSKYSVVSLQQKENVVVPIRYLPGSRCFTNLAACGWEPREFGLVWCFFLFFLLGRSVFFGAFVCVCVCQCVCFVDFKNMWATCVVLFFLAYSNVEAINCIMCSS